MKALVLNGSQKRDQVLDAMYETILTVLNNQEYETDSYYLAETKIASCMGCYECWFSTPGMCIINDAGRAIVEKAIASDILVLFSPVLFGGYTSELKKAVDRLLPILSPLFLKVGKKIYHHPRLKRYPSLIGIGVLPEPDDVNSRIFKALIRRNATSMHCPLCTSEVFFHGTSMDEVQQTFRSLLPRQSAGTLV